MDGDRLAAIDRVDGMMNYLVPNGEKPVAYQYDPPPGVPRRSGTYVDHSVAIRNGRLLAAELSLDKQGFILAPSATEVVDFYDDAEVKSVYYRECERLVLALTGAARVHVFDHTVRAAARAGNGVREPVHRVHNDYTEKSGPQRVRDLMGDEAEALLKNRFAIINVWRPISGPVLDKPLGLCDAQTVQPGDIVVTDLKYPDRTGEIMSIAYNPAHRWFYFPRLERDEAVLLKCFDSATDGRARFSAHSAFEDPTTPAGAPPRESIEIRTLVFFPPS
jgi:hypothetical protein